MRVVQPFDQWLHQQLHDIYDSIAQEPLVFNMLVSILDAMKTT